MTAPLLPTHCSTTYVPAQFRRRRQGPRTADRPSVPGRSPRPSPCRGPPRSAWCRPPSRRSYRCCSRSPRRNGRCRRYIARTPQSTSAGASPRSTRWDEDPPTIIRHAVSRSNPSVGSSVGVWCHRNLVDGPRPLPDQPASRTPSLIRRTSTFVKHPTGILFNTPYQCSTVAGGLLTVTHLDILGERR